MHSRIMAYVDSTNTRVTNNNRATGSVSKLLRERAPLFCIIIIIIIIKSIVPSRKIGCL